MRDAERLALLVEYPPSEELSFELAALPLAGVGAAARTLALSHRLDSRLMGLSIIAQELARGPDPAGGARIAEAVLQVSLAHLDDRDFAPSIIAENAAQAAGALARAHEHAGRHDDIVALSTDMESRLAGRTDGVSLASLRLLAAGSLIALGRLEEAEAALDRLDAEQCRDPSLKLVRQQLDARLQSAVDLADARSADQRSVDQHVAGNVAAAEAIEALMGFDPQLAALAGELVKEAQAAKDAPSSAAEVFERAALGRERLAGFLGLGGSELFQWQSRVHDASRAFLNQGGHDPALLTPALETFRGAIAWYDANGQREDGHHARWCAYIAERRLGRTEAALDLLEKLAARLERDRSAIADPLRRANDSFPMLAAARVECADMVGDAHRMFAAIEAAKGRALADLRTAAEGRSFDEAALHAAPAAVAELVARLGIGYVTFIAIDVAVFAVAVWPDGSWQRTRIEMDEAARRKLSEYLQPRHRKSPVQRTAFDLGAALAPLTDWLLPQLATLPDAGHLVISPDGDLHMWPLHMAATPAGPLALKVGVSRVHGIDALRQIASTPPRRPGRAIAMHIPADDEGELAAKAEAMARTLAVMPDPVTIPAEAADAERFASLQAGGALLYVNGHGLFPEEWIGDALDPNPYRSAGMVLAHDGKLPKRSADWPHRLTPALVIESRRLDVAAATVVLQGCVSGLAKEGRGGDALGLEWAFLARGADTVLASHWNVLYPSAGAFCRRFCKAWLGDRKRRIDAWREAVAATRDDPEGGSPDDWAAFSLTGDWR